MRKGVPGPLQNEVERGSSKPLRGSARLEGGWAAVADGFEYKARQPLKTDEVGPLLAFELGDDEAQTVIAQAEDGEAPSVERGSVDEGADTTSGGVVEGDEIVAGNLAAARRLRERCGLVLVPQLFEQQQISADERKCDSQLA